MARHNNSKTPESALKSPSAFETSAPDLSGILEKYEAAQRAFLESNEYMDYFWSLDEQTMEVDLPGEKLLYPLVPVGTWSPSTEMFTWAFAVDKFPKEARVEAETFRGLGTSVQLPEYDSDQFELSQMNLEELLSIVWNNSPCEAIFKEKNMEPWVLLALYAPKKMQKKSGEKHDLSVPEKSEDR